MAIFYVSSAGSNTSPYDTLAKAATSIQTAIDVMSADGDIVIIDDETWVISTALTTNSFTSAPDNFSSLTIRSLGGDPSTCILSSDQVNDSVINFDQAVRKLDITLSGVGLTKSVTHTDTATAAISSISGQEGDITFANCAIGGFDVTYAAAADGSGPVIRCAGPIRLVSFYGCDFDTMTITSNGGGTTSVLMSSGANPNLYFERCDFSSLAFSQSGAGSICAGWIYARNSITMHDVTLNGVTSTKQVGATNSHRPFVYAEDTILKLIIKGANVSGLVWENGAISGVFAMASGPYEVDDITVVSCSATEPTVNNLACALYAFGDSADGTYSNSTVHDCSAAHGVAFYAGQGGGGTLTNITAYNNTATGRAGIEPGGGGGIYCGGWGDVTINNGLFYDNTSDEGGAIYAHVHGSATRSPTRTFNNITAYNNTATGGDGGIGGDGILVKGVVAAHQHIVNIINNISWNAGTDEIYGSGAFLTLNIDHSDVRGGAGAVTGEDSYTNNINSDPLFTNTGTADFTLQDASPCLGTGLLDTERANMVENDLAGGFPVLSYPVTGVISAASFAVKMILYPAVTGQTNTLFASYVDEDNYTAIITTATSVILRKMIAGSATDATETYTHTAKMMELHAYADTSGMGVRAFDVGDAEPAWATDADVANSQIGSTFEICSDGNGEDQFFSNVLSVVADTDKARLGW